jgi:hypothetical protein
MTDVVMPEECRSMPITLPRAWNQKGRWPAKNPAAIAAKCFP